MSYTVGQIADLLGLEYQGDGTRLVGKTARWESADETSLIFLESGKGEALRSGNLRAACIIVPRDLAPSGINVIFSNQPRLDFAKAAAWLHPQPKSRGTRHPTADIAPEAQIDEGVELGPNVVVEAGARIGAGSILRAGVVVGQGCRLGRECILHPRVVLYAGVQIGDRVILHAGVVVGSDGFGYVSDGQRHWSGKPVNPDDCRNIRSICPSHRSF